MVYLVKMVIFDSYVKLPEGISWQIHVYQNAKELCTETSLSGDRRLADKDGLENSSTLVRTWGSLPGNWNPKWSLNSLPAGSWAIEFDGDLPIEWGDFP